MLALTRADLAGLLDIGDVLDVVESVHASVALGDAVEATRHALPIPASNAQIIPMLAGIAPMSASGLKLLTDSPDNPALGLPRQQSVILLLDPVTNAVEAVLDGVEITRLRTAAASAVATRYLSRPDSDTLGLVGAGALARTHLAAIRRVRPIRRVLVWSRRPETLNHFLSDTVDSGLEVVVADTVADVTAEADIICTLTPAMTPVLHGSVLRPGTHVNAVGAPPRPEYREIDTDVIAVSRVVVDNRDVALAESGAIRLAVEEKVLDADSLDDLGQVITSQAPGRTSDLQITLYNSVGLGIQDVATARLAVRLARQQRLGTEIALSTPRAVAGTATA